MGLYKNQKYHSEYSEKAELLAPAGSYEAMEAAVLAGADAVYLGGHLFGARAYANNLDESALKEAIDFVHLHGRKLYLTVNTLVKERELKEQLYTYLAPFYEHGLDAVIVQDIGVFSFIRKYFPDLSLHASTQMTITGPYGAKLLKEMGAKRIITARELSLEEIRDIHKTEGLQTLEIESFVHGALCYCYSGQCLFSSIVGGRSGNRGRCAQPCRLPYQAEWNGKKISEKEKPYLLSLKDLCSIELLPDILEAGVTSLKIEGRMKKPEYTAGVVSIYRYYLDQYLEQGRKGFSVSKEDKKILQDLYNRGGFTKGYYLEQNGRKMMFLEGKGEKEPGRNEALFQEIREQFCNRKPKEAIYGKARICSGEKAQLTVMFGGQTVTVIGGIVSFAQNQSMTKEEIQKQLEKTGNTPFYFSELSIETDGNSFIRINELNQLRRNALKQLTLCFLKPFYRYQKKEAFTEYSDEKEDHSQPIEQSYELNVYLEKKEYVEAIASFLEVSSIYLDASEFSAKEIKAYKNDFPDKKFYFVLPPIFRETERNWLEKEFYLLIQAKLDGFMARNLDELSFLIEKKREGYAYSIRLDSSLYAFNRESLRIFEQEWKAERITLPLELNAKELSKLADKRSELVVYGYLPMMITAQCTLKNLKECQHMAGQFMLIDRYRNKFTVKNICKFCYNRIYNCKPLSLLSVKKEVDQIAPGAIRLDFTLESKEEVLEILQAFLQVYQKGEPFFKEPYEYTKGHFNRKVE